LCPIVRLRKEVVVQREVPVGWCDGCGKESDVSAVGDTYVANLLGWGRFTWPLPSDGIFVQRVDEMPHLCSDCSQLVVDFIKGLKVKQ
jgi:hypothetical protein